MFRLDWDGGAGAVIDIFRYGIGDPPAYHLRYGSPFRRTMRAPAVPVQMTDVELGTVDEELRRLAQSIGLGGRGGTVVGMKAGDTRIFERLADVGGLLFDIVLPTYAQNELLRGDLFLEIGTDELLLHYPWELMHDGEDFLCLHHHIGRFVNLAQPLGENIELFTGGEDRTVDMNVLLISVPRRTAGMPFSKLAAAEEELQAVLDTLHELGIEPEVLIGKDATFFRVRKKLKQRPYQIVHFCGHALFNEDNPQQSALVLYNQLLTTAGLTSAFRQHHPTLCFINGCETARSDEEAEAAASEDFTELQRSYSVYGLARPFLEAGSYLLGSRWRLADKAAAQFAKTFYYSLLGEGLPIGRAITQARRAVYESHRESFAWASYVYYGDPRVQFTPMDEQAAVSPAPPGQPAEVADEREAERARLNGIAQEYEAIRTTEPSGPERSRMLESTVTEVVNLADEANFHEYLGGVLESSQDAPEGDRIVALDLIQRHPDPKYAAFVYDAIAHPQSDSEQFHALVAARNMVDLLDDVQAQRLRESLVAVSTNLGTDRALLARDILGRLGRIGGDLSQAIDALTAEIQQMSVATLSRGRIASPRESTAPGKR